MTYEIAIENSCKRDLKLMKKRGYRMEKLYAVLKILERGDTLPPRYRNHKLVGNYEGLMECHIAPDWLLIYYCKDARLHLARTGTHADLFE